MFKMTRAGHDHRDIVVIGRGYHFLVADGTAGLYHRRRAGRHRFQQTVGEGKKGVRCDRTSLERKSRHANSIAARSSAPGERRVTTRSSSSRYIC